MLIMHTLEDEVNEKYDREDDRRRVRVAVAKSERKILDSRGRNKR